jgi:hypothetical protein
LMRGRSASSFLSKSISTVPLSCSNISTAASSQRLVAHLQKLVGGDGSVKHRREHHVFVARIVVATIQLLLLLPLCRRRLCQ